MRREGKLMVCTIEELAEVLAKTVDNRDVSDSRFTDCDFCIVEGEDLDRELVDIRRDASGWYGVKQIDAGFDSQDLVLVCDYYGGGCPCLVQVWSGMDDYKDGIKAAILKAFLEMLNIQESARADTMVVVDFVEKPKSGPKKYVVYISNIQYGAAHVEAESPEEAKKLAEGLYNKRSIDWYQEEVSDMTAEEED